MDDRRDRNSIEHLFSLAKEKKYVTFGELGENNSLTHVFMAHPTALKAFRNYPPVVGIDSTYKTNRYGMTFIEMVGMSPCNLNFLIAYAIVKDETVESYEWVLRCLRNLIGGEKNMKVIFTDRELGLIKPIKDIFPHAAHLLCTWHINRDVEAHVAKICNNKSYGERFKDTAWAKIVRASTVKKYDDAVRDMKASWSWNQAVINYVEKTWLLPHKERFVRAWTNKVLHFGNTTTCRVESAHSALKAWLQTSTSTLDTIWRGVNLCIDSQIIKIKDSLEKSRTKRGKLHRGQLLQYLVGNVSRFCLENLRAENLRMTKLGDQVWEHCGCVLRSTYGVPCACFMKVASDEGRSLYLDEIHPFFRTLVMGDGVEIHQFSLAHIEDVCCFSLSCGESFLCNFCPHRKSSERSISLTISAAFVCQFP